MPDHPRFEAPDPRAARPRRCPATTGSRPAKDLASEIEWAKSRRLDAADLRGGLPRGTPARRHAPRGADPGRPVRAHVRRLRARPDPRRPHRLRRPARRDRRPARDTTPRPPRPSAPASAGSASTSTRTRTCSSSGCSSCGLGDRQDVCVVGDEDQTIYTFTGASSDYLTGFADAAPGRAGRHARRQLPIQPAGARAREPAARLDRTRRSGSRPPGRPGPEPDDPAPQHRGREMAALVAWVRARIDGRGRPRRRSRCSCG